MFVASCSWGTVAGLLICISLLLGRFLSPSISHAGGSSTRLDPSGSLVLGMLQQQRGHWQQGAACLCWAWSLELAHSPAQHWALALPDEALAGAAASDGLRTGGQWHQDTAVSRDNTVLQGSKDALGALEIPPCRNCQDKCDVRDVIFLCHS